MVQKITDWQSREVDVDAPLTTAALQAALDKTVALFGKSSPDCVLKEDLFRKLENYSNDPFLSSYIVYNALCVSYSALLGNHGLDDFDYGELPDLGVSLPKDLSELKERLNPVIDREYIAQNIAEAVFVVDYDGAMPSALSNIEEVHESYLEEVCDSLQNALDEVYKAAEDVMKQQAQGASRRR